MASYSPNCAVDGCRMKAVEVCRFCTDGLCSRHMSTEQRCLTCDCPTCSEPSLERCTCIETESILNGGQTCRSTCARTNCTIMLTRKCDICTWSAIRRGELHQYFSYTYGRKARSRAHMEKLSGLSIDELRLRCIWFKLMQQTPAPLFAQQQAHRRLSLLAECIPCEDKLLATNRHDDNS